MSEKNSKLLTELSQVRTLYSNQRTYLAYLRTGFAVVSSVAKKRYNNFLWDNFNSVWCLSIL